ncbi:MAG TPA: hypothetical protein VIY53_11355 [Acidobacteriaceae bacterium]
MKVSRVSIATLIVLVLGFVVPALAIQDKPVQDQDHTKQETARQQAKPTEQPAEQEHRTAPQQGEKAEHAQQPERQRPAAQPRMQRQEQQASTQQRAQQQQRVARQETSQRSTVTRQQEHVRQSRTVTSSQRSQTQQFRQTAWQQHRAGNWQTDHRTWQQRGGYNGYRIPDDRFRGSFGEDHGFRIHGLPFLVVGGYPRFQYGGYWLSVVDPWPASWGNNWYDSDDVYVVYVDNGYYLYNRSYPGVGMAISISM